MQPTPRAAIRTARDGPGRVTGVVTRPAPRVGSGVAAGAAIAALAVFAHVSAGGTLTGWGPIAGVVGVLAATAATAPWLRWTFPRVALGAMVLQPVLHVAFAGGHSSVAMHGAAHSDHAVQTADHSAAAHAVAGHSLAMPVAHVAIALVTAVVLQWGLCWLRSMPGLVRAIVGAVRPGIAQWQLPRSSALRAVPVLVPVDVVPLPWDSRGPPRVA